MTQDTGSEEGLPEVQDPIEDPTTRTKRSTSWQWLALAILLLIVIWLIWQYLGSVGTGPDTSTTTAPNAITSAPDGTGIVGSETVEAVSGVDDEGPEVPDVIGMSRASAIAAIRAAGYEVSVTDVYGTSQIAGAVFQQNPTGGTRLGQGGTVGLLVQLRPGSAPEVTVPRLTGLSQSAAERKLKALGVGVVLSYTPDPGKEGRVHSQWPLAGDMVAKGGDVQIQVTVRP